MSKVDITQDVDVQLVSPGDPVSVVADFEVEVIQESGQGPPGPVGPSGPSGLRGSLWYEGTGAPGTVIGALNNDNYLNTANGDVYTYSAGSWGTPVGNLRGPQGPQGVQGIQGIQGVPGVNGNTILSGTTNPAAGTGNNGDFYINTATNFIFGPKASGAWPAGVSMVGPPGGGGPSSTLPLPSTASGAVGVSSLFARGDHVHPQVMPFGFIGGLNTSSAATPNVLVAPGSCIDSTNAVMMQLSASMTKTIGGGWVAGNNQPGLGPGVSVPASGWMHVFACRSSSSPAADVYLDTDYLGSHIPAGMTYMRRIWSFQVGSSAILPYIQSGDTGQWKSSTSTLGYNIWAPTSLINGSYTIVQCSVPPNIKCQAILNVNIFFNVATVGGVEASMLIYDTELSSGAIASNVNAVVSTVFTSNGGQPNCVQLRTYCSTSNGSIATSIYAEGSGTQVGANLFQVGWIDRRGQDG
jgi:hypothetical protein